MVLSFLRTLTSSPLVSSCRVWKSAHDCPILEQEWQAIVHNSAFLNTMPIINTVSFHAFTALVVLIMSCQFLYALCYSIPVSPNLAGVVGDYLPKSFWDKNFPDYQLCQIADEEDEKAVAPDGRNAPPTRAALRRGKINKHNTPLKLHAGQGRAVQALADAGRMYTLNWYDDKYLEQAESKWHIQQMCLEMQRTLARFFLFGVQATMITYLQVSYIGFQNSCSLVAFHSETGGAKVSSLLTVFSAVLALATGANYIIFEVVSLRKHWNQLLSARQKLLHEKRKGLTREDWWEPRRLREESWVNADFRNINGFHFHFVVPVHACEGLHDHPHLPQVQPFTPYCGVECTPRPVARLRVGRAIRARAGGVMEVACRGAQSRERTTEWCSFCVRHILLFKENESSERE